MKEEKLFIGIPSLKGTYIADDYELSKKLTKEALEFLEKKGIYCKPLDPPDKGGGGEDIWELIREIIEMGGILMQLIGGIKVLVKIFKNSWLKIKDYFKKNDANFSIFLFYKANKKDCDEIYGKRIIGELLDVGLMLHEYLSKEYSFIKFGLAIDFSVSYKNFYIYTEITPSKINIKNVDKLKSKIQTIQFKKDRGMNVIYSFNIKKSYSKTHYENGGWGTSVKTKKYGLFIRIKDYINKIFDKENYF